MRAADVERRPCALGLASSWQEERHIAFFEIADGDLGVCFDSQALSAVLVCLCTFDRFFLFSAKLASGVFEVTHAFDDGVHESVDVEAVDAFQEARVLVGFVFSGLGVSPTED